MEYTPQLLHIVGGVVEYIPQFFENIAGVVEYTPQLLQFFGTSPSKSCWTHNIVIKFIVEIIVGIAIDIVV